MERFPVESSQIASVGYDKESQTLEVEFVRGGLYQYSGVPESTFNSLMSSDSKGSFLSKNVKGVYAYERVGD